MKIMLAVCMFGSTAWAADQQEVTLHGEIREFVEGDIYKIADEAGRVFRVDLGRYSGRLLNRTPFEVRGTMKEAKEGAILVADYMDYRDPDPFKEYFEALREKINLMMADSNWSRFVIRLLTMRILSVTIPFSIRIM